MSSMSNIKHWMLTQFTHLVVHSFVTSYPFLFFTSFFFNFNFFSHLTKCLLFQGSKFSSPVFFKRDITALTTISHISGMAPRSWEFRGVLSSKAPLFLSKYIFFILCSFPRVFFLNNQKFWSPSYFDCHCFRRS